MADPEAATASQLRNIEESTGRNSQEWYAVFSAAGLTKPDRKVNSLTSWHALTHRNDNPTCAHRHTLARQYGDAALPRARAVARRA